MTRAIVSLPDRVIVLFLCAVAVVGPLAAFGQFRPVLVAPLFVVLAVGSWRLIPAAGAPAIASGYRPWLDPAVGAGRSWLGPAVALAVVVGWVGFNAIFRSELYLAVRDPAVYTLRALWLVHHASPDVDVSKAVRGAGSVTGAYVDTAGFPAVSTAWQAQGTSLVPGLLACFGWIAGTPGVLCGDLVIGAVGLLAVYALARRLLGPIWALVPMVALACSMPMVAFSRAPYTEPTALALCIGGLVLMWISNETGRQSAALLAGLSFGATFLARPDGLLFVTGGVIALGIPAVVAHSAQRRTHSRHRLVVFIAGAWLSIALALVDLAHNSSAYEATTWSSISALLLVAAAVSVVLPLLSWLLGWRARGIRVWKSLSDARVVGVRSSAVFVLLAFTALALRPLYYTAHQGGAAAQASIAEIANRQALLGLTVDGSRTYDEQSVTWLSWYFSWPVVVMGALGACLAVAALWSRRDARPLGILAVVALSAALYLNSVQITPDQIWAMRRFLPTIVPGGLILATLVPFTIWRRWRRARAVAVLAAALMILAPVATWRRTLITREYGGAEAFTAKLCPAVQGSDVIIADHGSGGTILLPALRIVCGVSAVLLSDPTPASLNQVRANWSDGRPVTVVAFLSAAVPWQGAPPAEPYESALFDIWTEPLTSRPVHVTETGEQLWIGSLDSDGRVK